MRVSDFSYELPDELIAREPPPVRTDSRLMLLDAAGSAPRHHRFAALPGLLHSGDLLVFNDTRVIPARLFGCKHGSGGAIEILVERVLDTHRVLAQVRASKPPRAGSVLSLFDSEGREALRIEVRARRAAFFELQFPPGRGVLEVLGQIGHMPLPPYIDRPDRASDRDRYQTVYAARDGAVAAPTAGLHFDEALLDALRGRGIETRFVTLHVGAGTFQPLRCDEVEQHRMHAEYFEIDATTCEGVTRAHAEGRRVVAVGTTSLRALESAASEHGIAPAREETGIFIYPGYRFRTVDALITNFHLPESTLLMLVSAFAGRERVLEAYRTAVRERYRFFSYGDAMLVEGVQTPAMKVWLREAGRG